MFALASFLPHTKKELRTPMSSYEERQKGAATLYNEWLDVVLLHFF